VIGDVSQHMGWESGSPQKIVLHGMAGLIEVKMAGGQGIAGATAAMVNEALTPAMAEYVDRSLQERGLKPGSDAYKHEFDDLMKAGSTLVGAAAGALAGNSTQSAAQGASVALTATVNNYLKHNELKTKQQQLAACKDQACRDNVNAYWTAVSERNNAAAIDACIAGSAEECRAKVNEVRNDIAQLSSAPDGTGLNKFTPEANNNLKQATEKYRTDLEILAQRGNEAMGTHYSSPDELAKAGYLSPQEAADLKQLRLGTMIDFAGAVVLPGGTKANGNKPVPRGTAAPDGEVQTSAPTKTVDNALAEADYAGRVPIRPRDGTPAPGTPATDTPLGRHLIEAEVVGSGKNVAISGGHNMDNLMAKLAAEGGTILSKTEVAPGIGIYQIEYQLPGGKVQPKTVYDPARYSDAQMAEMASEAAAKGLMQYQLTGVEEQFVKVGGVVFRVPIAVQGKNFSPAKPAQPYVPTAYPVDPKTVPTGGKP
jgi:hypothetical protein